MTIFKNILMIICLSMFCYYIFDFMYLELVENLSRRDILALHWDRVLCLVGSGIIASFLAQN